MGPLLFQRVALQDQFWFREISEEYESDPLRMRGLECNIDDVLVHGKDQTKHDQRLEAVLMRLVEAGVILNLDKCQFSTDRVTFLGHAIRSSGIEADPEKLQAIADLPPPIVSY